MHKDALRFPLAVTAAIGLASFAGAAFSQADSQHSPPRLELPIDCELGRNCFVQQYFDHDPGPGAKDFRCGAKVYDKHDGVDIRLSTTAAMRRGVAVLTAADGIVARTRDGEPDRLMLTDADRTVSEGRECGNGLVINHAGGWTTQYCHMRQGSIAVSSGQPVKAGDRLGFVGLSGFTQFPHVHFSVRHGSEKIDPFAPKLAPGTCSSPGREDALWSPKAAQELQYRPVEIINAGFSASPLRMNELDEEQIVPVTGTSSALLFYARAIGLQAGDTIRVTIASPSGETLVDSSKVMERRMAQYLAFAGKRRTGSPWQHGRYVGTVTIARGGQVIARRQGDLAL